MEAPSPGTPDTQKPPGEVLWRIRPAAKGDVSFIMDSWLRSFRRSPYSGVIPRNLYTQTYSECIRQLLVRGAKLLVAANPDNAEHLLGFICHEPGVLHFAYVKEPFRQNGICKSLFAYAGLDRKDFRFTFKTYSSRWLGGLHSPEIARRKSL